MKVITSLGGPFVCLDLTLAGQWSGSDGKRFIGEASPHPNDYEAGGYLTEGRARPPCSIAHLEGLTSSAFLISMPCETALLRADDRSVHIAQAQFADPEWSFDSITTSDFENADFGQKPSISFYTKAGPFVVFDSVYPFEEVDDNRIEFALSQGEHRLSAALWQTESFGLILCRIDKL